MDPSLAQQVGWWRAEESAQVSFLEHELIHQPIAWSVDEMLTKEAASWWII